MNAKWVGIVAMAQAMMGDRLNSYGGVVHHDDPLRNIDLEAEYELIMKKKSGLSSNLRARVVRMVEGRKEKKYKEEHLQCGKSGAGKDYIAKTLNLKMIVSHTTRKPRKGEMHGVDKWFHSEGLAKVNAEDLTQVIAYTKRGRDEYWTTMYDLNSYGNVYIIDVPGIVYMLKNPWIKQNGYDLKVVYIDTPLIKRVRNMRKRGMRWRDILSRLILEKGTTVPLEDIPHQVIKM